MAGRAVHTARHWDVDSFHGRLTGRRAVMAGQAVDTASRDRRTGWVVVMAGRAVDTARHPDGDSSRDPREDREQATAVRSGPIVDRQLPFSTRISGHGLLGRLRAGAMRGLPASRRTQAASICLVAGTRLRISMAAGTLRGASAAGRVPAAGTRAEAGIQAVTRVANIATEF